ncbi:MAG: class I SAM-dependent methyltransferase [Marinifilaceae bacterium]|jgi:SAM-dependent methyltransferase|nr:class I SAM-dependent methyltransferase [Marinifilaceae bacterium]
MFQKILRLILKFIPRPILIKLSLVLRWFSSIILRGNNKHCPVCKKSFRKFLPYGYNKQTYRTQALCPNCLSLERHRLIWNILEREFDFFDNKLSILHVAPEQCFYKRFRKIHGRKYTTADIVSPLADVLLDIQKIPFKAESFDMIICNHVLEHVDNDIQAMSEIHRVLKNKGRAILQVPMDNSLEKTYEDKSITSEKEREIHFLQKDHVRLYGVDYKKRLESVGFTVHDSFYVNENLSDIAEEQSLPRNEIFYFISKNEK